VTNRARRREERTPWTLLALMIACGLMCCWLAFCGPGTDNRTGGNDDAVQSDDAQD